MSGLKAILHSKKSAKFIPNHVARRVGVEVQRRIDTLKIGQKMQDLPEELWHKSFRFYVKEDATRVGGPNLRMIRLDPKIPSLTVTGYIFNKFVHPYENRFITVREAARLQGFPDTHEFIGTLTSTQLQVGNAVPIQLSQAVFNSITQQIKKMGFPAKKLSAFSLFSGAGGMDIGAENTGFIKTKVALEYWKDACDSLQGFFKENCVVLNQDITAVSSPLNLWKKLTKTKTAPDIIYGGPPCQAFSQAGKQKALEDERGTMIFHFLRFVEDMQPNFFVMENVANLKGVGGGSLYNQILEKISKLGYNCTVGLLLAADFGAPQLRRRLFFLASKKDIGSLHLPTPTHSLASEVPNLFSLPTYSTVEEAFSELPEALFSDSLKKPHLEKNKKHLAASDNVTPVSG